MSTTVTHKPNLSHRTAITRSKPSLPMRFLDSQLLLQGRSLDFGCGRGFDTKYYGMHKYDPHWHPHVLYGQYETITCNYVLNVIPTQELRLEVLEKISGLLTDNGKAYITVRRDIKQDTKTQFVVKLDHLQVLKETAGFCTYILRQDSRPY